MEREKNFQRFLLLAMAVLAIIFYEGKLCWELIILAAYTGALYGFFCVALRKAGEADRASLRYGICFFAIFAVPVYAAASYFATPQVIVMTVGILLLLVMLAEKKRRDGLFGGAALALAVLIAYLPRKDVNMAEDETVHAVVDQFGGVLSEKMAVADLAVFLVLMLPYLWITVSFFRSLIREIFGGGAGNKEGRKYLIWLAGGAVLLPAFFLREGYGLTVFAVMFYYIFVWIAWLSGGDDPVRKATDSCGKRIAALGPSGLFLLIWAVLIQPLGQFPVSRFGGQILRFLLS